MRLARPAVAAYPGRLLTKSQKREVQGKIGKIEGMPVLKWTGKVFADSADKTTLHGTAMEIHRQLLALNPDFDSHLEQRDGGHTNKFDSHLEQRGARGDEGVKSLNCRYGVYADKTTVGNISKCEYLARRRFDCCWLHRNSQVQSTLD